MSIGPSRVAPYQPPLHYKPFNNTFGLVANEKIFREWFYADHTCCCSDSNHTVLTDIRLLTRYQESWGCGIDDEASHIDSAIFLRDIDQIRECRGEQPSFVFLLWMTLVCAWPCYLGRRIFCPKPKCLEVFGRFGSEIVRISPDDMSAAQVDLSTAVINSKIAGR